MIFIRHVFAIAALPFVVTVVVPVWLARRYQVGLGYGATMTEVLAQAAGLGLLLIGLALFVGSLRRFAVDGKGTLAPWDPPRHLVVRGLYRYVRNPMISGVVFILFGEALLLRSEAHAVWASIFLALNVVVIPLVEEPQLRARFGADYIEYCNNVPRLLPRLRPWDGQPRT